MVVKILYALCICLRIADVRGSTFATSSQRSSHWSPGVGSSRNVDHSNAPLAYEATVTTEMNYYATDSYTSKSEKKRSHHAEYEYVGAGGYAAHGIELPKSGKKGGYYDPHYTIEPTDYDDTVVPTHYPKSSKSGKKENIHSQEPTHAPTYWGTGYHDGKGSKSKGYSSKKSGISKKSSKKGGPKDGHIPEYTHHPTPSPENAASGDYGRPRPPTPVSAPTSVPPGETPTVGPDGSPSNLFTASPTNAESLAIDLKPFSLLYETATKRQASRAELAEVTDVTRLYLEEFMFEEFAGSSFTVLDDFVTRLITSTFLSGESPYVVDYSSTARFDPFSSVTPSTEQLDEALVIAFTGENLAEYTRRLETVSTDNVFHAAQAFFDEPVVRVSEKPKNNAASIAAAAVAATLIAAGIVLYKRRTKMEHDMEKDIDKGRGDATVAGETFTGETYEGSASASVASLDFRSRSRDDDTDTDRGPSLLGTIEEDEDDDSVQQGWVADSSYVNDRNGNVGSFESTLDRQNSSDTESTRSIGTGNLALRRVSTDGGSVAASSSVQGGLLASQSFDDIALQGFGRNQGKEDDGESTDGFEDSSFHDTNQINSKKPEIMSLLSHDSGDAHSMTGSVTSSGSRASRRARTVEEIEAMLAADSDDDEESQSLASRTRSFGNDSASMASSHRPRTVEEIESLLSAGLDDDRSVGSYANLA